MGSSTFLLLLALSLSLLMVHSYCEATNCKEIHLGNPVLQLTPSPLDGYSYTHGAKHVVSCDRVKVASLSRGKIRHYANSVRVNLIPSVVIPERLYSKIEVCFHWNSSLGLCQCAKDEWKSIQNGLWSASMSPYDDRYVDVEFNGGFAGSITVSIEEEFHQWRLFFLAFGFLLLLLAPVVSNWVPFYYSSSMAIGVFLIILILLFQLESKVIPVAVGIDGLFWQVLSEQFYHFHGRETALMIFTFLMQLRELGSVSHTCAVQGMKLLPTGKKNVFYLAMYGSLLSFGSLLVHYFSMLINSILVSFGLSEDMHNPVAILVLVGIVLAGAALGYWIVRKFVISEDGTVDDGIAEFVKWAMRVMAMAFILMSTLDTPLAMIATASSWAICHIISSYKGQGSTSTKQLHAGDRGLWSRKAKGTPPSHSCGEFLSRSPKMASQRASRNSLKRSFALSDSPTKGLVLSPLVKERAFQQDRDYYSTFHKVPTHKRLSKNEYEDFTSYFTRQAIAELASSHDFTSWIIDNASRIQLLPDDSSDDSMVSGSGSSEETVVEGGRGLNLFKW